jgi:anthranilate phosphoribosyltransferase
VLEALGVRVDLPPMQVARAIDEIGLGFCFAPLAHGAMKHAAPVRKQLGFRTIFNMLGPLTNPAGADFQLIGAGRVAVAEKLAQSLARLGTIRALVVCGNDELDEVSLWGRTTLLRVERQSIEAAEWRAADFGLEECTVGDLRVSSPAESAQVIREVLKGAPGPARNIVLANAAAALIVAEKGRAPREAVGVAAAAIDSGRAGELLNRLIDFAANQD